MNAGHPGDPLTSASAGRGPTVLRIVVGSELRRMREASGLSRTAAADAIRASEAKMSRLEAGKTGFRRRDVADLLTAYGITEESTRQAILTLAEQANNPGWWHPYNDAMPDWFVTYVGLEQAAEIIRCYEAQFIPGLLQTEAYARAVIQIGQAATLDEVEQRVALRMKRQQLLDAPHPPDYWAVVDEAVLRRKLGSAQIMRDQLDHLIVAGRRPNVTVQVVPFERSDAAASGGPFTLLRFSEPDLSDVVYLEQLTSALYLDKRADAEVYLKIVDRLAAGALTPRQSAELIAAVRDSL